GVRCASHQFPGSLPYLYLRAKFAGHWALNARDGCTIAPIYVRPLPVLGCFLGHWDALFEFFAPLMTQS
ncbi:hypothetical protein ACG3QR_32855, partial [Pseudomonas aeruginosa]